jgi:tryptophan synthase alpha chain
MSALEAAGALALEIGVPFSDPIADGPDIQRASEWALARGMSADGTVELVRRYRRSGRLPVIVMTYANPILRRGIERFASEAREAGVDAVLVSDLPPDESPEIWSALDAAGLATVMLVAPTTPAGRLPMILERCRGFVYCLARTGVTGGGTGYAGSVEERVRGVRRLTPLPVVVGFGIASADQARALRGVADAIVVGAAFMRDIAANPDAGVAERVGARAGALIAALR